LSHNLITTTYVVDNIRKIREDKGLAQQQMSDLVGMHRSNFSKVKTA
jgi:transcriptional regulator with XRE-family HTH domain